MVMLDNLFRLRFADGSGVCVQAKSLAAARKASPIADRGPVVAGENAYTDEILWASKDAGADAGDEGEPPE